MLDDAGQRCVIEARGYVVQPVVVVVGGCGGVGDTGEERRGVGGNAAAMTAEIAAADRHRLALSAGRKCG